MSSRIPFLEGGIRPRSFLDPRNAPAEHTVLR
jgi:hypothetical protein